MLGLIKSLSIGELNMKNIIKVTAVISIALVSAPAMSDLTSETLGTREAICYNHPNKKLCIDGVNMLMVAVKNAAQLDRECEAVEKLGGSNKGTRCEEAKKLLNTLGQ